ncbi:hypothetical protein D477_005411 [Arthrobacter crystallopoietes BAB-32]|uniref:DUF4262 domain-containing protein n=1 Tax=Arthrobacter crystallopoietes BAB-32 TaxID=1246476 RepID=N1V1W2_9MICC|nr:DUF4262 domain-containing protein [Arthrobacter crystallopoietes]EMY35300.1 hypothetical protein D477_005411 [Arthrobacter crystallopoietes BAB-32]
MCDICNGMSVRQLKEKIRMNIARHGWHATLVENGPDTPAFGYTIGLTEQRQAEILVTGRSAGEMYRMLAELAHMILAHGDRLLATVSVKVGGRRVYLAPVEEPHDVLLYAAKLYGHRLRAVQAVWADDSGHLPWQQEIPDVLTQPLYGTPPGLTPLQE